MSGKESNIFKVRYLPGRYGRIYESGGRTREYVAAGRRWVVDMDLEKFFDRVNHDVLMARRVGDKGVLCLIRRGICRAVLLRSAVLLDDLDKELECRSHTFCRYADDANIYVHTGRSLREEFRRGRGGALVSTIKALEPKLRG